MLTKGPLYYLASPYSHASSRVRKLRYKAATQATLHLLDNGVYAFSPIAYNAPMTWGIEKGEYQSSLQGFSWATWRPYDSAFIKACAGGVIVLLLPGWAQSIGVRAELCIAKKLGRSIYTMDPDTFEVMPAGDSVFDMAKAERRAA